MTQAAPASIPWPAMSVQQAYALITQPGTAGEMEEVEIRGVKTRTWKNAPPTLRDTLVLGRAHGEKIFLVHEDERVSFEAFYRATTVLAAELAAKGVQKGDRVAIVMRNLPEWPVAFYGALSIGAIVTPLNAWWTGAELEYGLLDSGAKTVIVDVERYERLAEHFDNCPDLERVYVSRSKEEIAHPYVSRSGDGDRLPQRLGQAGRKAAVDRGALGRRRRDDLLHLGHHRVSPRAPSAPTATSTATSSPPPPPGRAASCVAARRRRSPIPTARSGFADLGAVLPRHRLFRGDEPLAVRRRQAGHDPQVGSGQGHAADPGRAPDPDGRRADHRLADHRASQSRKVRPVVDRGRGLWRRPVGARSWCARSRKSGPRPRRATAGA
jgi:hypothetical protein